MKFFRWVLTGAIFAGTAVAQQPTVNQNGVVNAASYSLDNPRGSLITIFGTNMAQAGVLLTPGTTPLSTQVKKGPDTVSVTINDTPAPIQYVSTTQTSVQVPWGTKSGTATVVVTRNGVASPPQTFHATTFSPGIFNIEQSNKGRAWAINAITGTVAQPTQGWPYPKITALPAKAGDHLYIYATGLGPVNPLIADGAAPCSLQGCAPGVKQRVLVKSTKIQVLVGGVSAKLEFAGLAPQFPGVYQVNFQVPEGVTAGDAVPVQIQIEGGGTSTAQVTLAIQ